MLVDRTRRLRQRDDPPDMSEDLIEPVRAALAERYSVPLAACDGLRDYVIRVWSPWAGRAVDKDSLHEQMLVIVLSRSLNTYWSAVELARMGFGPQAAMLNRSLFEDMIDAHWITVEPKLAVQRIDEHHQHGRMLLAEALRAEGVTRTDKLPTFDSAERSALDDIFGRYGERSWTGLNIHSRVIAVEHLWEPVDAGRELLHFYRRLVHRESNQILHLSAFSMRGQVHERTDTMLTLPLGPNNDYVEKALFAAFYCFGQLIGLIRDTFDFGDAEEWQDVFDAPLRQIRTAADGS